MATFLFFLPTTSDAQTHEVIKPASVSVVFAPPAKTPPTYLSASSFGTLVVTEMNRIKLRVQQPEFRRTLTAKTFLYTFPSTPSSSIPAVSGLHTVRLGLIEPESPCSTMSRKMVFTVNGIDTRVINVANEKGCLKPLFYDVPVTLTPGESITVQFTQLDGNSKPSIANLRLYQGSAPPVPPLDPSDVDYGLDIDSTLNIPGTSFVGKEGTTKVKKVGDIPQLAFDTGRSGSNFTLLFDLPSGTYDVSLVFIELQKSQCSNGGRVFNVYINGKVKLPAFDIYKAANSKCLRSNVQNFLRHYNRSDQITTVDCNI